MSEQEPSYAAQLIEYKRNARGISVREAARRADLSEGRWRQIAKGYQSAAGGMKVPVNAPLDTLARMARAVGLQATDFADTDGDDLAQLMQNQDRMRMRHPSRSRTSDSATSVSLISDEVLIEEVERRLVERKESIRRLAEKQYLPIEEDEQRSTRNEVMGNATHPAPMNEAGQGSADEIEVHSNGDVGEVSEVLSPDQEPDQARDQERERGRRR